MHIPKTAGTSVIAGIAQALDSPTNVSGLDRSLFGQFDDFSQFASVVPRVFLSASDMPEASVVMGHFCRSTLATRYPDAQLVTFLREPLTRLLSHWVYWRCQADEELAAWGDWKNYVKKSRNSLKVFLNDPQIACQTDNVIVRMLLWPHADISDGGFIPSQYDKALLSAASRRLSAFSYSNIVENVDFNAQLANWLGKDVPMLRLNQTRRVPESLRLRLDQELDDETFNLLRERCRLDLSLWSLLAESRIKNVNLSSLRQHIIIKSIARYSALLAP